MNNLINIYFSGENLNLEKLNKIFLHKLLFSKVKSPKVLKDTNNLLLLTKATYVIKEDIQKDLFELVKMIYQKEVELLDAKASNLSLLIFVKNSTRQDFTFSSDLFTFSKAIPLSIKCVIDIEENLIQMRRNRIATILQKLTKKPKNQNTIIYWIEGSEVKKPAFKSSDVLVSAHQLIGHKPIKNSPSIKSKIKNPGQKR